MKKVDFLLRGDYENWLKDNEFTTNSRGCYIMNDKINNFLYYDVIASFLYYNERTYAYSVLEKWFQEINRGKNVDNRRSYLQKYKQFIQSIDDFSELKDNKKLISSSDLKSVRNMFKKNDLAKLAKIDGMDSLIKKMGEKEIVKLAIESSFFFAEKIAEDRFGKMKEELKKATALPARKSNKNDDSKTKNEGCHKEEQSEKYYHNENDNWSCKIKIDGNGNAKVCQIINEYTGYNLAYKLENKPFVNFIISHIWGRAIDPRYFTSFWNIVLVPAWVNHLLDKEVDDKDSFTDKLKTTFKKICILHNDLNNSKWKWSEIGMEQPPSCENNYFKNKYTIQVIGENKEEGALVGSISTKTINIKI